MKKNIYLNFLIYIGVDSPKSEIFAITESSIFKEYNYKFIYNNKKRLINY